MDRPELRWGPGWPYPRPVVLQDRSTGTNYLLSHDSSTDRVALASVPARISRNQPERPLLQSDAGVLEVFVSGAILQYELSDVVAYQEGRDQEQEPRPEPLQTKSYSELATTYEVYAPDGMVVGDALGLRKTTGIGSTSSRSDLGAVADIGAALTLIDDSTSEVLVDDETGETLVDDGDQA